MAFESDPLVFAVIGCAIEVHRVTGAGIFESASSRCLAHEFMLHEIPFETNVPVRLNYKGIDVGYAYRADFVVEGKLLLELKSVESLLPVHKVQVLTYLRLLKLRQGLLINFNVPVLRQGIKSVLNPEVKED
jgi:GxxExxY protein